MISGHVTVTTNTGTNWFVTDSIKRENYIAVSQLYYWKVVQLTMKLFIIVVVSVIVCCNAQGDDSLRAVQLLEAILNETKVTRELQNTLINEVHSARQEAQDYHEVAQQWYTQPNVFVSFASCEDIKTMSPSAPSGYYTITKYDGTTQRVHCDMEHFCGSEISGWTRVAYLDMSDPSQQCPTELRLYNESGVRACGRRIASSGSCDSVTFSTNNISYSQVCGRVIGYQYGTPFAFHFYRDNLLVDDIYVDGISITHEHPRYGRQHIWSLAAGYSETTTTIGGCPCNTDSYATVPSFVGDDYFCESGSLYDPASPYQLYTDDPLWDGEGCGIGEFEGPCCNVSGIPWFHKVLYSSTTDDIELRVCADDDTNIEDTPVSLYELYVK